MDVGLLGQVRAHCRAVAESATHIRINYDHIPSYVSSLPLEQVARPEHEPRSHYLGHGHDTVAFFLTLDTINFGSGYFPHLHKHPGLSGYFTIAASLTAYFAEHGPMPAETLAQLTAEDCAWIFGQDLGNAPIHELMHLFSTALNDLGQYLLARFDGSFVRLVEAATCSAERLVGLLIKMPYFNDVATYGELEVPFYKRAQISAADLAIALNGQGHGYFTDLHQLTMFADNLVPHVLRLDGILQYEHDLAEHIDREELIPAGSAEEVEIRACALHAVELLGTELRRSGLEVPPMQLDYVLWNRGQQPYYKARPRHRTRTVYY